MTTENGQSVAPLHPIVMASVPELTLPKPYYDQGGITLYHGDSAELVGRLPDNSIDLVLTDPPYKLSQEYTSNVDADNLLAVTSIWPVFAELACKVKPGGKAVVFYDTRILPLMLAAAKKTGWQYLRALTFYRRWGNAHKLHGWMSTSDFVLVFQRPGAKCEWGDSWSHDTFVRDSPETENWGHVAQKPISLVRQIMEQAACGGVTVDPYAGSGTTLRAAKDLGLRAIGFEQEERNCEIAAKRLSQGVLF